MANRDKKSKLADKMSHNMRYAAAQQLADAQASMDFMELLDQFSDVLDVGPTALGVDVIDTLDDPVLQVIHDSPQVK